MVDPILVKFDGATVRRLPGGEIAIPSLTWTIRSGEAWAIVGPNGSGKSTLAETLAGRHRVSDGLAEWLPSSVISLVGFREESRAFSYRGKYYQQRYEFIAGDEEPVTLRTYLGRVEPDLLRRFGLLDLIDRPFVTLSNGQTRKARIIKALTAKPRMLVLDDPYVGLDAAARIDVNTMLADLHRDGMTIVLIGQPGNLPDWIMHRFDCTPPSQAPEIVLELTNVTVRHGNVTLLRDLSWTVRRGERWAIVGPNGSGKTTLLSLLCGDHPQAYSQDVKLFGQRRGSGESIWDVKARVGLVSPEWHLYFTEPLTALQTIATGFTDTLTARPITDAQRESIRQLAEELQLTQLLARPFPQLSSGEQRLILLARSLIKKPELLIWDEPFQCLDASAIERVTQYLARQLTPHQTLLIVSHDPRELPAWVNRTMHLTSRDLLQNCGVLDLTVSR